MPSGQLAKRLRRRGTLGAVKVEPAAHTKMAALIAAFADVEAMEDFDFEPGEEIRHPVARDEHGTRIPAPYVGDALQPQLFRSHESRELGALEKPRDLLS